MFALENQYKYYEEIKQLKDRINKAIEYIKDNSFYIKSSYGRQIYEDVFDDIKNILKGNDYEKETKEIDT